MIWSIGIIQKWEGWIKVLWGKGINGSGFSSIEIIPMNVQIQEAINTLNNSFIDGVENAVKKFEFSKSITLDTDVMIGAISKGSDYRISAAQGQNEFLKDNTPIGKGISPKALEASVKSNAQISGDDKEICAGLFSTYGSIPFTLNTRLHVEEHPSKELIPGNIYVNDSVNEKDKKDFLQAFFRSPVEKPDEFVLIDLEVSPVCDYAQNKWKKSRLIHGVIFPLSAKPRDEYNYYTVRPSFILEGKVCRMIFDFHHFGSIDLVSARSRVVKYRLKRELLLDIIANLSSHVNRPGISLIE